MTYQESSDRYRDETLRHRIEMSAREQGIIYAAGPDPEAAALGLGVTGGIWADIDAVIAAVVVGPNGAVLDNDADLLAAVQAAWPIVAAARHPQEV